MTGTPEGSTESGFMEKPGIEPATPGLQGIALIHYTTGASLKFRKWVENLPEVYLKFSIITDYKVQLFVSNIKELKVNFIFVISCAQSWY